MQTGRGFPRRSSVNRTFITEEIPILETVSDPLAYIASEKATLAQSLRNALRIQGQVKWYPASVISFIRNTLAGVARVEGRFTAPSKILLPHDDIDAQIEESVQVMLSRAGNFADNGSDFIMETLQNLEICTSTYNPVGGSSYIPLPKFIENKKCVINVKNQDERCFEYSILAHLILVKITKMLVKAIIT